MLRLIQKEVLPPHHICSVIYYFKYQCDTDYIGRMGQRLEVSIIQHLPANIQMLNLDNLHRCINASDSVITEHLLNNYKCNQSYNEDMFLVLRKVYSDFHFQVLEFIYIKF